MSVGLLGLYGGCLPLGLCVWGHGVAWWRSRVVLCVWVCVWVEEPCGAVYGWRSSREELCVWGHGGWYSSWELGGVEG
ncbi:hypothetical protein RIF29_17158 [Crotalaria pallida]|uniref:Uncharacterized protein n=1 Tax=Crotalaria pallida TaxID=3830 RepID=A0AAN9FGM3_CROPI